MKKVVIGVFISIILLPSILKIISNGWNLELDVPLLGFTDVIEEPVLTYESFQSGEYQTQYADWFEYSLLPRGEITRLYATIRYNAFNLGNRIIGENKNIFEYPYISVEYTLTSNYDMSVPESKNGVDEYITCLEEVQRKLNAFDKDLYIYIAANKADFNSYDVPQKYIDFSSEDSINIVDYLRDKLADSTLSYEFCADLKDELVYPAFYPTGIHWSRTFEQLASQSIIRNIAEQTGRNYRNLVLTDVKESDEPFERDADVFELLNVWNRLDGKFYEYSVMREDLEDYDKMRFLIWGDSFAQGLYNDILDTYPNDDIYCINYYFYVRDPDGEITNIDEDWSRLDLQRLLDNTDVVVLGCTENNIPTFSNGFVQYLNQFLDTYVPGKVDSIENYISVDSNYDDINWDALHGIWAREDDNVFLWTETMCEININKEFLGEDDLQIDIGIPEQSFENDCTSVGVCVYIDGNLVSSSSYVSPEDSSIIIRYEDICGIAEQQRDYYDVEIITSRYTDSSIWIDNDDEEENNERDLALKLYYFGGEK